MSGDKHLPLLSNHFSLRDGQSIHSMSALMLLLIQTCCHGVDKEALRITNAKAELPPETPDYPARQAELSSKVSLPTTWLIVTGSIFVHHGN